MTAEDTQRDFFPDVTSRTMRRALCEMGYDAYAMAKKTFLIRAHKRNRLLFANSHKDKTLTD